MKQLFNTLPFTKITKKDYLLIVPLAERIVSKFIFLKLKAWELIGEYPSLHSKAHITVNHDPNIEAFIFEEKLAYYQCKLSFVNAFEIAISGFDYFKHHANSYTIYAKVKIDATMKSRLSNFHRMFPKGTVRTPHVTIAKTISKKKYDILWAYFEKLNFECSFYADKITVLETPTRKFNNLPMRQKADIGLMNAKINQRVLENEV